MDLTLHFLIGGLLQYFGKKWYIWVVPALGSHFYIDSLKMWEKNPINWFGSMNLSSTREVFGLAANWLDLLAILYIVGLAALIIVLGWRFWSRGYWKGGLVGWLESNSSVCLLVSGRSST